MRAIALTLITACSGIAVAAEEEENIELIAANLVIDELKTHNERLQETIELLKQDILELKEEIKVLKARRKKGKNPTEDQCIEMNTPFNKCGWRCLHKGGTIGGCVNSCMHFIKGKRGRWCLDMWGPGFG